MKNLKKLISVIIAVIMIVGSFATVSAADYADVESTNSYYKAIQVLSGLGIAKGVTENEFSPKSDVTRAQMVTFICRAMGEEDIANGAAGANFTDVAADHWAAGYIAWGVNRGIINGMGDGTFAPEAPVKYQDAVVMIMRALGYDRIAQRAENGGYPTGYLKVASQRAVLNGAGYDSTKAATREIIAQLINNALTAPIVEVSTYGLNPEDDRYIIHEANADGYGLKCLLTTTNKIYRVRATVADSFLVNPDLIKEDGNLVSINIDKGIDYPIDIIEDALDIEAADGVIAADIYAGASELNKAAVGEVVELYIAEDEDLNDWVALAAVGSKSTVSQTVKFVESVVAETEGEGDDEEVVNYVLTYKENASDSIKKAKEIDIDPEATIYVNNKITALGAEDLEDYIDVAASWTLVRPKSESKIKGVFLTVYTYKTVKEVSVAKERIYFYEGGSLKLDAEARDNEKFFYNMYDANGKAITIEDVKVDDVLNILVPAQEASINEADSLAIYVTSNTVEGTVDEEIDATTYVIEGEEYVSAIELEANETGKFYVSIDGKIIYVDTSVEVNKNFAVVSYAEATKKMGKSTFDIDLLTKDGAIETYSFASKVKFFGEGYDANGTNCSATSKIKLEAAFADITDLLVENTAEERLITYKVNADGDISEIRLPGYYGLVVDSVSGEWDADFEEIDGQKAADAVLLIVPTEAWVSGTMTVGEETITYYTINEDEVEVASFADIANGDIYPSATIYQTDKEAEDFVFTFALGKTPVANQFATAPVAVVKQISTKVVGDDRAEKITFVQSGDAKAEKTVEVNSAAEGVLGVGDVFQYALNADGEIEEVRIILDYSKGLALTEAAANLGYRDNKYAFALGYLAATTDGGIKLANDFADDDDAADFADATTASIRFVEDDAYTYANVNVYGLSLVKPDKNAIKAIDLSDIEASKDYKEVSVALVRIDENGKATDIVVFEDFENGLDGKATADLEYTYKVVVEEEVEE